MSVPPEILFHRSICRKYPRGLADLDDPGSAIRWGLRPGELSAFVLTREALNGLPLVRVRGNVVAAEDSVSLVAGHVHGDALRHPRANEIAHGRPALVVEQPARQMGAGRRLPPLMIEIPDPPALYVEHELGDRLPVLSPVRP